MAGRQLPAPLPASCPHLLPRGGAPGAGSGARGSPLPVTLPDWDVPKPWGTGGRWPQRGYWVEMGSRFAGLHQ